MILLRHAEPLVTDGTPADQWPLTDQGRREASALGRSFAHGSTTATVWTSPERRASETAALVLPSVAIRVREQLSEVKKPRYITAEDHARAVASYLMGETVLGWERRDDGVARLAWLETDFNSIEGSPDTRLGGRFEGQVAAPCLCPLSSHRLGELGTRLATHT
jgi:hypothetical protein